MTTEDDPLTTALARFTANWKEARKQEVARALLDASNAMFRKDMSAESLQTLVQRYDEIIGIMTKNVHV